MHRVMIVINSLHSGGAEKTCIALARHLRQRCDVEVVSLIIGGPAEQELRSLGIKVTVLEARTFLQKLRSSLRLAQLMRASKPDTVVTFLYIADLVAGALARILLPRAKVFWNIRNNVLSRRQSGRATFVVARVNALLSRFVPSAIVYCSAMSRSQHEALGFRNAVSAVVENSAANVPFSFSPAKRNHFRGRRFEGEFLFLMVGRFDPVKRVDVYVDACVQLHRQFGGAMRFVIAGRGMDVQNQSLMQRIESSGIADRFVLLGHVEDQQEVYSAADCLVVTSESEGSPNAVYEALAVKLPVVIFATLGTESVVGETVVRLPHRDMDALVQAMRECVVKGAVRPAVRVTDDNGARPDAEHSIVGYYRRALPCG
ncbi:MAG TPA: glycosyltransferase [Steroidobacteraceae bacterium]|jgi:glycosyltransferase involved in cell wall biosynthesis